MITIEMNVGSPQVSPSWIDKIALAKSDESKKNMRSCNICGERFLQVTRFDRFCQSCRINNDLYRHVDWAKYS